MSVACTSPSLPVPLHTPSTSQTPLRLRAGTHGRESLSMAAAKPARLVLKVKVGWGANLAISSEFFPPLLVSLALSLRFSFFPQQRQSAALPLFVLSNFLSYILRGSKPSPFFFFFFVAIIRISAFLLLSVCSPCSLAVFFCQDDVRGTFERYVHRNPEFGH